MKKVLNILTASAMALAFVGCSNVFVDNNTASDSAYDYTAAYVDQNTNTYTNGTAMTVSGPVVTRTSNDTTTFMTLDFTFNMAVNPETATAISLYALSDAADDKTPYTETAMAPEYKVVDNHVYLNFSYVTKDFKGGKYYIDSTKLASVNGVKLNSDGDRFFGEAGDDDIFYYFGATAKGREKNGPQTLSGVFSDVTKKANTCEMTLNLATADDMTAVFASRVKLQKYDLASKAWVDFQFTTTNKTISKEAGSESSQITFTWDLPYEDTITRAILTDIQGIATTTLYDGYAKRWTLDNAVTASELDAARIWTYSAEKRKTIAAANMNITLYKYDNVIKAVQIDYTGATYGADLSKIKFVDEGFNTVAINLADAEVINKKYDNDGKDNKIGTTTETYVPSATYLLKTPVYVKTAVSAYADPTMTFVELDNTGKKVTKIAGYNLSSAETRVNPVVNAWRTLNCTTTTNPINY